jgi:hypothetical protein
MEHARIRKYAYPSPYSFAGAVFEGEPGGTSLVPALASFPITPVRGLMVALLGGFQKIL